MSTCARRLLVVTTTPQTFDAFLVPYARHLSNAVWRVDLATGAGELSPLAESVLNRVIRIPWSRRARDPRTLSRATFAFRSVLKRERYDITHLHTPIAAAVARAAIATIRPSRRPRVVYTAHGFHFGVGNSATDKAFVVAEWMAGRFTDRLIVMNELDRCNALRFHVVPSNRLVHLPGIGVDLEWYRRTESLVARGQETRAAIGASGSALLSMFALLEPRKGHTDALRALASLPRRDVHLAIGGEGPLRPALDKQIAELGLVGRVHLLGGVPDPRALMVASDATLLPSRREGMSRAVLESLAIGTPVVGYDTRGIADSVKPDGGLLVPVGDIDGLSHAMSAAVAAPLLDDARRAAIRHRLEPYSTERLLDEHMQLYSNLLAGQSA